MLVVPLGIYISVPFCRTKCSFCNFASGVVGKAVYARYVERVCADLRRSEEIAREMGGRFESQADSVYLGGGTPTVLEPQQLRALFSTVAEQFALAADAEITVECAPGTLTPELVDTLVACGVNRVSLGVQSFVDQEASSVGRLHSREIVLRDLAQLRRAGIRDISVDLIAGLPHQTEASWRYSLEETLACDAPHVSVYMLEVDDESRLGRELMAGGARYHAHFVPDDELTADLYLQACETLPRGGLAQYEISNFARPGRESRHNLKYWTRQPYLGFGVDAHSMLPAREAGLDAVRFATADDLEPFLAAAPLTRDEITCEAAGEEELFLGLRLNRGVGQDKFQQPRAANEMAMLCDAGLLEQCGGRVRLTARGRLLSNEVFQRFIRTPAVQAKSRVLV